MGLAAAGWLAGAALQLQQPALWPAAAYGAMAGAAGVVLGTLVALRSSLGSTWRAAGLIAAMLALLAFSTTGWRAADRLSATLAPAFEGRDLVVTGVVDDLPRHGPTGSRFVLAVESATQDGQPVVLPPRLSLAWYPGIDADALLAGPGETVEAGQRWRLTVRLRRPHGTMNPHGFDLELWLFERGLGATGYVRSTAGARAERLADGACCVVARARERVRAAIGHRVDDPGAAGVLAALAVGDQGAIERDDWDVFRATGIAHLVAISGVHVTMFAWLAGGIVGRLWRRSARLMLALPAPTAAAWGGLAAAAGYAVLAGWGVPAQRTVWMLAVFVVLRAAGRRWPTPLALLAAAVVVTVVDPWALLQPGFWLSFVAVGLLIASEPAAAREAVGATRLAQVLATSRQALRTQAVATVGLAPLTMIFFQQVSVVGFVANLVAIPLVTLFVTPLALLGIVLPALWLPAAAGVQALVAVLQGLAAWPGAVWTAAAAPVWAVAAGLLGGVLAVLPGPARLRLCGVALIVPLLIPAIERPPHGGFDLLAADVGQGTAVLVRTRQHLLVYDTGPRWSPVSDAGARILVPLLRGRGERHIDRLVLSHADSDHTGGASSLMDAFEVGEVLGSLPAGHPLRAATPAFRPCEAGQRWQWDGVDFAVLHPPPGLAEGGTRTNAMSCVLRVAGDGRSVLLTGDIEAAQEAALVAADREALRSEVLLVPHHGSRTSSTPAFLEAVEPSVGVVQAGYRSRFGHPAPDVMARYHARAIEVVRSDTCGAWRWPADAAPVCERLASRRYWHHPGR